VRINLEDGGYNIIVAHQKESTAILKRLILGKKLDPGPPFITLIYLVAQDELLLHHESRFHLSIRDDSKL